MKSLKTDNNTDECNDKIQFSLAKPDDERDNDAIMKKKKERRYEDKKGKK